MKTVTIYTDGACSGNPGPGGWGAVLIYAGHKKQLSGGENKTTNIRMEMTAALMALRALTQPCEVHIHSDSAYLVNAHTQHWLDSWIRHNWKRGKNHNEEVLNADLWQALIDEEQRHKVIWHKVEGHAGLPENELCDKLAVAAAAHYK